MSEKRFTMTASQRCSLPLCSSRMQLSMSDCMHLSFTAPFECPLKWLRRSLVAHMAGVTWNCCSLGTCSVCTVQPCSSLQCHVIQSHIRSVHNYVFSCNLPPALLAERPGSFACYCRGGANTEIRMISTESWPWRRNSPAAPAGTWTRDFLVPCPAL